LSEVELTVLLAPGFTVDTLYMWVKPQHLENVILQDISLFGGHKGLNDRLVEEDVEHVGER
jgi:stalled ribosome rescue protein Dom34